MGWKETQGKGWGKLSGPKREYGGLPENGDGEQNRRYSMGKDGGWGPLYGRNLDTNS